MEKSISFIGAGRITNIILQAFENRNISLSNLFVFDTNTSVSEKLKLKFPEIQVADLKTVSEKEIVFVALHPPVILETLSGIKDFASPDSVFISLAPKITIEKISLALSNKNIVRLIPNATSVVNEGYNPVCFAGECKDKSDIFSLLSVLGTTFETEEPKLEAYAVSSAMLSTYFWFQWFELVEIAQQMGLTETESRDAIEQTLVAAIHTAFKSGMSPDEVTDLIPVKPIGENEMQIKGILQTKLMGLFDRIKP